MPFIQTTDGLVLEEEFDRPDSSTIGNGWEDLGSPGNQKIESEIYDTVDNNASRIYQEDDLYPLPAGDTIFQFNTDFAVPLASAATLHFGIRSNEKAVGAASRDLYLCILKEGIDYEVRKIVNNANVLSDFSAHGDSNDIRCQRMTLEDQGGTHIVKAWQSAALASLDDLTKDFVEFASISGNTDFEISSFVDMHHDRVIVCGNEITINNIPTGWKISIDGGVTKIVETAGSVTYDPIALGIALPVASIKIFNPSDVQKDAFTGRIFGGSVLDFRRYPEDAMVTGVFR
jgi:hypothetical protein